MSLWARLGQISQEMSEASTAPVDDLVAFRARIYQKWKRVLQKVLQMIMTFELQRAGQGQAPSGVVED